MKPNSKPKMTLPELQDLMNKAGYSVDTSKFPVYVIGVRGYYEDTMGEVDKNDRGMYDDALFIVAPGFFAPFNGNTDPSKVRKGTGKGEGKGMAVLNAGVWHSHGFGLHKKYPALIQIKGEVTVTRDGNPPYPDTGYFGINIHKGGYNTTSSEGCQTIHPEQWDSFISTMHEQAKKAQGKFWNKSTIPYVLIDYQEVTRANAA